MVHRNTVVIGPTYARQYEEWRRSATTSEVKTRAASQIDSKVNDLKGKKAMDFMAVMLSVLMGSVVPLSGLLVVVPEVIYKCLEGGFLLGLIPILNIELSDIQQITKQTFSRLKDAGKNGAIAAVETIVLEVAKQLGLGAWLWEDVLKEILIEIVQESFTTAIPGAALLLAGAKWWLHRHGIKHMYDSLGKRAKNMHGEWIEQNL